MDTPLEKISGFRDQYKNEWEVESSSIDSRGHYDWMASFIKSFNLVLEIGSGTGKSTLKLLNNGHKVISIDENVTCLNEAFEFLTSQGKNVKYIKRENISSKLNSSLKYVVNYSNFENVDIDQYDAVLIEGDILNDNPNDPLIEWFKSLNGFDVVICWLIGTHAARKFNQNIEDWVNTPADYRIVVQNTVYEVSDSILRSGGALHIVDRGQKITPDLEKIIINSHKEQASVTTLKFHSLDSIEYGSFSKAGVEMVNEENKGAYREITKVQPQSNQNVHLISVMNIKP